MFYMILTRWHLGNRILICQTTYRLKNQSSQKESISNTLFLSNLSELF